jgi:hypothetical protein
MAAYPSIYIQVDLELLRVIQVAGILFVKVMQQLDSLQVWAQED